MYRSVFGPAIARMQELIQLSEPPYNPPHHYMNQERPLTPKQYERPAGQESKVPTRVEMLRHALWILACAQEATEAGRNSVALMHIAGAQSIMLCRGIPLRVSLDIDAMMERSRAASSSLVQ